MEYFACRSRGPPLLEVPTVALVGEQDYRNEHYEERQNRCVDHVCTLRAPPISLLQLEQAGRMLLRMYFVALTVACPPQTVRTLNMVHGTTNSSGPTNATPGLLVAARATRSDIALDVAPIETTWNDPINSDRFRVQKLTASIASAPTWTNVCLIGL